MTNEAMFFPGGKNRCGSSGHAIGERIRFGRLLQLLVILPVLAVPACPFAASNLPVSTRLDSLSTPVLTLRVRFEDGTLPAHVREVRFLRGPNPEWCVGEAVSTSNPSIVVAGHPARETRWVNIYAYAPYPGFELPDPLPPGRSPREFMARYDCFLPFDASDITTNTARHVILPRGNASLRVCLLPPDAAEDQLVSARLETVWRSGESSMIMPGVLQTDGTTLFAPVWPGVYYVSCTCNGAGYRKPVAIQDGEQRDEGVWPWPDSRIRGQLLDPAGSPSPFTNLHFLLAETDGFDLPMLGSIPLEGAVVVTDSAGRFECSSLLPGIYQPVVLSANRWDQDNGPDHWPFATQERVSVESGLGEADVRLFLKPEWLDDPRFRSSQAWRPSTPLTYDPTNGTVCTSDVWRVKQ